MIRTLLTRIRSAIAWRLWQSSVRSQIKAAQGRHGRSNEIRNRQTALLHAALAAGRKQGA